MNVLVTGGAGFIGSHLCERLVSDGHRLTIMDELNDFYAPAMKHANLDAIRAAGPFTFFECDICDRKRVFSALESSRPEVIVHLAARAGVRPSVADPLLYERVNVRGTMTLLEAARVFRVKRFVFASSSSVYGVTDRVPFSESDYRGLPASPYAATKAAGEALCYTYSHLYGIAAVCLRFFTVFGPRQRPDLAIRKFTEMIEEGLTIPVFGDGSTRRDYTFVDDIVQGVVSAMAYDCAYEIFNLGNSQPVSLTKMIETIEQAIGKRARIRRLPEQPGDVPLTYADVSKAGRLLGYAPKTPIQEGIPKYVEWYLSRAGQGK